MTNKQRRELLKAFKLKAIKPSSAIQRAFFKQLAKISADINKSVSWWALANIGKNIDKNTAKQLSIEFNKLLKEWDLKIKDTSKAIARRVARQIQGYADLNLQRQLENTPLKDSAKSALAITPPAVKQALTAHYEANLALIKTIPRDIIERYKQGFMQGIANFDREALLKLAKQYNGISHRRAKLIARDQVMKGISAYQNARAQELGFKYYVWNTSQDERVSKGVGGHIHLNGRIYAYDNPTAIIDSYRNKGHCGQRVNCLAKGQGIDFDYFPKRLFRADCELASHFVKLAVGDEILIVTSDHKVLTSEGWIKAQSLNKGDYIIQKQSQNIHINKVDFYQDSFILSDFFSLFDKISSATLPNALRFKRVGVAGDFDKNIRFDKNIDIIDFHSFLRDGVEFFINECLKNIDFANATMRIQFKAFIRKFFSTLRGKTTFSKTSLNTTNGIVGFFSDLHSILFTRISKADKISLATRADMIAQLFKVACDNISSDTKIARHFKNAIASHIGLFQFIYIQSYIIVWARLYALNKHTLPNQSIKNIARNTKFGTNILKEHTLREARIDSVTHISGDINNFTHIYSLETNFGYYSTNKGILSKNCRCVATSLLLAPTQDLKLIKDSEHGDYYEIVEKS